MPENRIVPSAQPVLKTKERPTFNNPGKLVDRSPKPPFAFESSRREITPPAR